MKKLLFTATLLYLASCSYFFDSHCDDPASPHYHPNHARCGEFRAIQMIGLAVCFSAIFLKLPTVLAVLEDVSNVKNISFRVLFAQALLNICQISFCLYFHAPFYRFGEHMLLLPMNGLLMLICMIYPSGNHDRLHFFIGLQVLLVIAIIYFLEDVEVFFLETSPYVLVASVISFRVPQIYMMIKERKAGTMNIYIIFLAIGINTTRVIGFLVEEMTDLRPYISNITPLLCNIVVVYLYFFWVEREADTIKESAKPIQNNQLGVLDTDRPIIHQLRAS